MNPEKGGVNPDNIPLPEPPKYTRFMSQAKYVRHYVEKPGKQEKRPLGVPAPEKHQDKVLVS